MPEWPIISGSSGGAALSLLIPPDRLISESTPASETLPISTLAATSQVFPQFTHMAAFVSILVVLAHASSQPRPDAHPIFLLHAYAFFNGVMSIIRMPTFFFISGFLFMHTNPQVKKLNYSKFVWKKIGRLLVPYIALSSLAFPIKAYFSSRALRPISFTFSEYLLSLCDPMRNPVMFYWFLMALFGMFILAPLLRRILLIEYTPLIAAISLGLLVLRWTANSIIPTNLFALEAIAAYLFYFWIGMVAWLWRDKWTSELHPKLAVLGIIVLLNYYIFARDVRYIRFIVAMLGIYSVYCFIAIYMRHGWSFLRHVDGKTYQVYLMAWFPQQFVLVFLYKQCEINFWLCSCLMFATGILLPLLATYFIREYFPSLGILIGLRNRQLPVFSQHNRVEGCLVQS